MWRSILWINLINDESSTNYKLKRKKKNEKKWKMWRIFKAQNAEGSKCFKCVVWSALFITTQAVIISKLFHHFAKVLSLFDAMRNFDDASFRWRELSIAAPPPDLRTNEIFVTSRARMRITLLIIWMKMKIKLILWRTLRKKKTRWLKLIATSRTNLNQRMTETSFLIFS